MNAETIQRLLNKTHRNDILIRHIATGGFGSVWLLRDPVLNRLEALKAVERAPHPDPGKEQDKLSMELAGVQTYTGTIPTHPNLVTVHDALHVDGTFLYFMEAADNVAADERSYQPDTLLHRLRKSRQAGETFPLETIRSLFLALLDGIEALHDKGICHRDIKLENVIFINGIPKLTDMGGVADPARSETSGFIATPAYTPRYRSTTAYDPIDHDLYALGIMLYCCLTGYAPERFPELPPHFLDQPIRARLNRFLMETACTDVQELRCRSVAEWREQFLAAWRNPILTRRAIIGGIVTVLLLGGLAAGLTLMSAKPITRKRFSGIPSTTMLYADSAVARSDGCREIRWQVPQPSRQARLLLYWPDLPIAESSRITIRLQSTLPDFAIWSSFYPESLNLCVNLSGTWKEIGFLWNSLAVQKGHLILSETRERNYVRDLALCRPTIPIGTVGPNAPSSWLEIRRDGSQVTIHLDGQLIAEYDDPVSELEKDRFLVGFQSRAAGELIIQEISFRFGK